MGKMNVDWITVHVHHDEEAVIPKVNFTDKDRVLFELWQDGGRISIWMPVEHFISFKNQLHYAFEKAKETNSR